MAKIVLATENIVLREFALAKERITIGRGPQNDIVIDDRAISAEHAVIVAGNNGPFLEDLNSTNGTQVNGQPVRQHFLQDGDVVELARYRIRYVATSDNDEESVVCSGVGALPTAAGNKKGMPVIRILNGPHAGKETSLTKSLSTIGRPGAEVTVIVRCDHSYYISCVEGSDGLLVNGKRLESATLPIIDGTVIDLSGTQMQFLIP